MIEYIAASNIDDRVLVRAVDILRAGGLVAFPTDSSWTIACSFTSREGIKRLRRLSGERDERHFTLLCASIAEIGELCSLDNTRFRLIKRLAPGPYVFILAALAGTGKALETKRREIGVRISGHPVPGRLAQALGNPLYTITAKRTMGDSGGDGDLPDEDDSGYVHIPEEQLFEGAWELEDIDGLDLILDTGEERPRLLSTVLDLTGDEAVLLRPGAGDWPV